MTTATEVSATVSEIQQAADIVLEVLAASDKELGAPAKVTELLLDLATKALAAYSASTSTPITADSLQALLPNSAPLSAPTN